MQVLKTEGLDVKFDSGVRDKAITQSVTVHNWKHTGSKIGNTLTAKY